MLQPVHLHVDVINVRRAAGYAIRDVMQILEHKKHFSLQPARQNVGVQAWSFFIVQQRQY